MNPYRLRQNLLLQYCLTHYYVQLVSLLSDSDKHPPKNVGRIFKPPSAHQYMVSQCDGYLPNAYNRTIQNNDMNSYRVQQTNQEYSFWTIIMF